jgi:L-alanine-DL-glutamate epimerase-like enolase superfamily enzyme
MPDRIVSIGVVTVRAALPEVIRFGDWVMRHREFALVRLVAESGVEGYGFTLTREGPVAAAIRQAIAHHYVGAPYDDPERLFLRTQWSNLASLSAGTGLRALSIVDLAVWDLKARAAGVSIARLLGGEPRPLPATAIVGYPPAIGADAVAAQVHELRQAGWQRFKIPITVDPDAAYARTRAAAEAGGEDAWLGMDAAWIFRDVDAAVGFLDGLDVRLGWFEDVFPPGDAALVAELRRRTDTPIAMGDEQGGSYFPEALLLREAVDVVRIDLTCMGGLSRAHALVGACERAGVAFAPHMFAHVHSQIFGALGFDVPIEWGVPGTGVDQFADSLRRPEIVDGRMLPLPEEPGFGPLHDLAWLAEQDVDDPDGVLAAVGGA